MTLNEGVNGMVALKPMSVFIFLIFLFPIARFADDPAADNGEDSYEALLHSQSLTVQRQALTAILQDPQKYTPRIQQSLRDYPRLLRTDRVAANRAVYISALVRDPSFPQILVRHMGAPAVLDECIYACPVVFALSIHACFAGWNPPSGLDSQLSTVHDLRETIRAMSRTNLNPRPTEDVVQGPALDRHRKEIEGKTEEQLIHMAGPVTSSAETRLFAAFKLETVISGSKNRLDLYLLALNDIREDASGEYRSAVYESIYRAELARAHGH